MLLKVMVFLLTAATQAMRRRFVSSDTWDTRCWLQVETLEEEKWKHFALHLRFGFHAGVVQSSDPHQIITPLVLVGLGSGLYRLVDFSALPWRFKLDVD